MTYDNAKLDAATALGTFRFAQPTKYTPMQPANAELEPLLVAPEALEILGVVSGVVRMG